MNILKSAVLALPAIALVTTPVAVSAADSNKPAASAATKLGQRIGARSSMDLQETNRAGMGVGLPLALGAVLALAIALREQNKRPISS